MQVKTITFYNLSPTFICEPKYFARIREYITSFQKIGQKVLENIPNINSFIPVLRECCP